MKTFLIVLAFIGAISAIVAVTVTRDGELRTPQGQGSITVDAGTFEAFPLPDYAAKHVSEEYKSYFVEVEPGIEVHVLELGSGYPVLLQHGNPTSGFLYRNIARELPTDRLRLIMPTLVGLGFSSKVPASLHTLENHIRWINGVLKKLQLTELVFVGQDWGGPIGMGALSQSPGLLKGAVLMNTGFKAPVAMMRMVTDGPDHPAAPTMRSIEKYVEGLDIPAEIIWGMSDPVLGQALPLMEQNFPNAPVSKTEAGHFLQEEVAAEIAAAVVRVVDQLQNPM